MLSPNELQKMQEELASKREAKRQRRRQRTILGLVYLALALLLIAGAAYYTYSSRLGDGSRIGSAGAGRVNVLILGVDDTGDSNRTDTIILASIDPKAGRVGVLSIPRDTKVKIPTRERPDKINAAYAYGGAELTVETVESLLDIPVDYYVKISFEGFKQLVDVLGGVEMSVEKDMRYDDHAQGLHIRLSAGEQVLNGEQALGYVRFRSDGLGDVALVDPVNRVFDGRVKRQLKFTKALAAKILTSSTAVKLPSLVRQLAHTVATDMPLAKAMQIAYALRGLEPESVKTGLIPGMPDSKLNYWLPDEHGVRRVVNQIIRGIQVISVEVLNGSGVGGVASRAAAFFEAKGLDVVKVGNADHFNYRETRVIAHTDLEAASEVARLISGEPLLLEAHHVASNADVTVIVGRDFNI